LKEIKLRERKTVRNIAKKRKLQTKYWIKERKKRRLVGIILNLKTSRLRETHFVWCVLNSMFTTQIMNRFRMQNAQSGHTETVQGKVRDMCA